MFSGNPHKNSQVPQIVHEVLRSPGQALDPATAAFMGARFGHDFSDVRVHTDSNAADSAKAVSARAYTVGRDVVFADGQFAPKNLEGQTLLSHELAHVVQQSSAGKFMPTKIGSPSDSLEEQADHASRTATREGALRVSAGPNSAAETLQRTPASKVDCAVSTPLQLPNGGKIDDPVGVITAAEQRARELLDSAIEALEFTRGQILSGKPVGWPTISDRLGLALELMGLDPNSERVWKAGGSGTAALLLFRLKWVRSQIGSGSFFFTCLGAALDPLGSSFCGSRAETETDVDIKNPALARTGGFHIFLCEGFWTTDPEDQALTIIHESMHTFSNSIQDDAKRGFQVAGCYERFVLVAAGSPEKQRTDLCPDPPR